MPHPTQHPLHGLVTATLTPFHDDGSLNRSVVKHQAAHMIANRVATVFIGGTTGESHSLTLAERLDLAESWIDAVKGTALKVVVHVGSNCLSDARTLAANAQQLGATAIAALSPSYFKPRSVDALVACAAEIASAAPGTPFYFYDIPKMTGVSFPMPEFLEQARDRIPTLAGIKFTNPDLMAYQLCLDAHDGAWDVPWGLDECLLAALAVGAKGAVGSGYNFAAPVYRKVFDAFAAGDLAAAREWQFRGVRLVQVLSRYGYMAAAKAVMKILGVDVGPPRLPHQRLTPAEAEALHRDLDALGFFDWLQP